MRNIYVYCSREQAYCGRMLVRLWVGTPGDVAQRASSVQIDRENSPETLFTLGPFLDRDEAESVQSQAHSVLSQFQIGQGRYHANPLEISEFCEWIDAQILPICVYEKVESAFWK